MGLRRRLRPLAAVGLRASSAGGVEALWNARHGCGAPMQTAESARGGACGGRERAAVSGWPLGSQARLLPMQGLQRLADVVAAGGTEERGDVNVHSCGGLKGGGEG